MRTKFIYLLLIAAVSGSAAAQDTLSLDDYRLRVLQYSYTLKQAAEQTRAAEAAVRGSYTGFLPQLSADGDFSINFRKRFQSDRLLKPYSFSLQPALVQQIYVGGSVRDSYRQAQVNQDLFRLQEQQSELDVAYLAEYNYWNLASNKALLDITTRYEAIVREMFNVVQTRFDDGYVARNDLLMIQTRLQEAEFSRIQIENAYRISLHNFNILRGTDPDLAVELAQGIRDSLPQPARLLPDEVLGRRPDYMAARLRSEQADAGIRAARAPFNPQVSVGIGGSWQPYYPNRTGATTVDGSVFVKLTLPIFHWGERRRATGAARAVQRQSEWNTALLHDNIVRDEMNGWTALVNSRAQVDATEQSLRIAGENLDISTYSYGEGLSTILDVLQAQLSWIQLYTNAIKAHYNYAVAVSDYLRITAQ